MNSAGKDICSLLDSDSSLGLTFATDLFLGREPATPDNCVTVFDIPGDAPQITLQGKSGIEYYNPSVQVRVRDIDYMTGWELLFDIQAFLHGINGQTEASTYYSLIRAVDAPTLLDWDENNRARFICTFTIQRRR
jgi:hypothetical protein